MDTILMSRVFVDNVRLNIRNVEHATLIAAHNAFLSFIFKMEAVIAVKNMIVTVYSVTLCSVLIV